MRQRRRILASVPILALFLAGCSNGVDGPTLNLQIAEAVRQTAAARFGPKPQRPALTRAVLDTLDGSFMEVVVERTGQLAYLYVSARRRDARPGEIVVWRTEDNVTLALRGGVLVATRGLGDDLLSGEVAIRPGAPGPAGSGLRRMRNRADDNKVANLTLACELTDTGAQTIEIVGARHTTRHLVERCEGGGGTVVNEYWVGSHAGSRAGLVWQSRQWAGPGIGYLSLRRLTAG